MPPVQYERRDELWSLVVIQQEGADVRPEVRSRARCWQGMSGAEFQRHILLMLAQTCVKWFAHATACSCLASPATMPSSVLTDFVLLLFLPSLVSDTSSVHFHFFEVFKNNSFLDTDICGIPLKRHWRFTFAFEFALVTSFWLDQALVRFIVH